MTNDKKPSNDFVHRVRLGKGQCFANEARTGLPQGVIPTFHMTDLSAFFANTLVCLIRKDELIGFPEIAVTVAGLVFWWNLLPQPTTGGLASIPDDQRHNLARATAHDCPQPAFVPSFINK